MTDKDNREEIIHFIDKANDKMWDTRGVITEDFNPIEMGQKALALAKEINYTFGIGRCLLSMGMGSFIFKHDLNASFAQLNEALCVFQELNNKRWVANTMLTMGIVHNTSGNPEGALYHSLRGLDYYENNTDEAINDRMMCYYVMGTVYKDLKKFTEAEKYYKIGAAIPGLEDSTWSGRVFAGLANIYTEQEKYDDAIAMSMRGLELLRNEQNDLGVSRVLHDIGLIYKKQKQFDKALKHFFEGLEIREKHAIRQFVLRSLSEIADVYFLTGDTEKAISYLKRAETTAMEMNQQARQLEIYRDLGKVYKSVNNFEQALHYCEKLIALTNEVNKKEMESKIGNLQSELVKEKEKEIEHLKNVELKHAYELISEKNREIMDSILYAKRIQAALLASDDILSRNLPEYFVFYKPKDIVSGDFYWAAEKNNKFYLAVCDSTGHGVPGAFMSLLNTSFLNEAVNVKNISEPQLICNHVRERLIENLSQEGAQDGMDGILICLDKSTNKITYAAANNSPVKISGGELSIYPADKMPVGKGESMESFKNGEISLKKGDSIYLYTDGFADQFGGEKGKKLKQKHLNALLLEGSNETLKQQEKKLEQFFTTWKGNLEQVDDVLLVGIRC